MTISRPQFETLIAPLVDESIQIVYRALEGAGIKPNDLDRVLLVGGSTRVPLIRQRLKEIFGEKIQIDVDPMQCVSLGAAVQTAFLPEDELQGSAEAQELTPMVVSSPVVIEKTDDIPEITMQDMISKYIGVETDSGEIIAVIPKGTLYPTHEPYRQIFQTNRSGQRVYELPLYESETEAASQEKWERIGIVRNEKLPPGLPKASDIMVEMSIDKDGILYVTSYLKNDPLKDDPEQGTLVKRSFIFVGQEQVKDPQGLDVFDNAEFHAFMFSMMVQIPSLRKYLRPDQIAKAEQLINEANMVLQTRDEPRTQTLLQQMQFFRKELPVPVEDMFWAQLITTDKDIVDPVERSSVQQIMTQMEGSAGRGDFDTANHHLRQLREKTGELFEKYPSNLLIKK